MTRATNTPSTNKLSTTRIIARKAGAPPGGSLIVTVASEWLFVGCLFNHRRFRYPAVAGAMLVSCDTSSVDPWLCPTRGVSSIARFGLWRSTIRSDASAARQLLNTGLGENAAGVQACLELDYLD